MSVGFTFASITSSFGLMMVSRSSLANEADAMNASSVLKASFLRCFFISLFKLVNEDKKKRLPLTGTAPKKNGLVCVELFIALRRF